MSSLVLRTVYVDDATDQTLTAQAQATGLSKGRLFRRLLATGVQAVRAGQRRRTPMPASLAPLILKTVELDPKVDHLLRVQAFDEHLPQSEVARQYLHIGLELSQGR